MVTVLFSIVNITVFVIFSILNTSLAYSFLGISPLNVSSFTLPSYIISTSYQRDTWRMIFCQVTAIKFEQPVFPGNSLFYISIFYQVQ